MDNQVTYRPSDYKWGGLPAWYSPMHMWPRSQGRYWKRQLSKARRRAWQNPRHIGGLLAYESTCNYKTW